MATLYTLKVLMFDKNGQQTTLTSQVIQTKECKFLYTYEYTVYYQHMNFQI